MIDSTFSYPCRVSIMTATMISSLALRRYSSSEDQPKASREYVDPKPRMPRGGNRAAAAIADACSCQVVRRWII